MYIVKIFGLGSTVLFKAILNLFRYFFIGLYTIITIFPKYFIIGIDTIFSRKKKKINVSDKRISTIMLGLSLTVYLICVFLISKKRWGLKMS